MRPSRVYHFSEDPDIRVFQPHAPAGRSGADPRVWAIDAEHAPLYWFPRDCPRVAFWPGPDSPPEVVERYFGDTTATRIHAIEANWLARMRAAIMHVYAFEASLFEPLPDADGHWVARQTVFPEACEPVGDLLIRHAAAGIELRITPSLWPLHNAIPARASASRWSGCGMPPLATPLISF